MSSQQIFVALLSIFLVSQQVAAVVNNGQPNSVEETNQNTAEPTQDKPSNTETDLVAESSDDKSNRREASLNLGDTYGPPAVPNTQNNLDLPVPVYGVPDAPSNNVVYPAPPPDIPPPLTQPSPLYGAPPSSLYGLPSNNYAVPSNTYGVPSSAYGAPASTYGVPSNLYGLPPLKLNAPPLSTNYGIPPVKYEAPIKFFPGPSRGPKPIYGPPRFQYGPPGKPLLGGTGKFYKGFPSKPFGGRPSKPFNSYGAPVFYKDNFSASKLNLNSFSGGNANFLSHANSFGSFSNIYSGGAQLSTQYGFPLKQQTFDIAPSTQYAIPSIPQYGPPVPQYGAPLSQVSDAYGPPDLGVIGPPAIKYGPPQPSPNPQPPHPGAPAPPTPPDIKYDGWQPIPGLTSKPNANYGLPSAEQHVDINFGNDLVPPPPHHGGASDQNGGGGLDAYALPPLEANHIDLGSRQPLSDSYGAPLNTVTGSGGIVASSGEEIHGGTDNQHHDNIDLGLSALGVNHQVSDIQAVKSVEYEIFSNGGSGYKDSYGAPPLNSFSDNGPYAAAHSYNSLGSSNLGAFNVHTVHNSHNIQNSNKYQGLSLSSSGIGLIPPSGVYGAPSGGHYGTPLYSSSFNVNSPKRPIFHKEPLHSGLFQNIAKQSAYRVGHGIHSSSQLSPGPVYLPPPVADHPRQIKDSAVPELSDLYTLPHSKTPTSFQSIAHSSSLQGYDLSNQSPGLTSYNVPLGTVDGSYGLPGGITNVGIDFSHPPVSIDLTGTPKQNSFASADCLHKGNSLSAPSTSYGAPIETSYGEPNLPALPVPQAQYGPPDLIHSSSVKSESTVNSIQAQSEVHGKTYGKSVAESFGPNSELIESQSVDLNNIPLQGALGTYTLQIQSADGKNAPVPHSQVLNEGLLQSILAAIEKPKSHQNQNFGPSIIQLQPSVEKNSYSTNDTKIVLNEQGNIQSDGQASPSNLNEIIVESPNRNDPNGKDLQLIDDNGIALYFSNISNKQDNESETTTTETTTAQSSQVI